MEFSKSAAKILSGMKKSSISPNNISSCIEAAYHVAGCDYEYGTSWGKEVSRLPFIFHDFYVHIKRSQNIYEDIDFTLKFTHYEYYVIHFVISFCASNFYSSSFSLCRSTTKQNVASSGRATW